jgi:phosphopantothenoylcysteine decarboxylase / phosphopantothenate---cysteine ligase
MLAGKHIIVGVTGSIAAYKTPLLVRELIKQGAEVRVIMTPSAAAFVTPLTLATLSQADVVTDMFPAVPSQGTWHIHLGMWADAMIVAPASANTIAKLAHGFADNALTALALALRCPLLAAPAMDTDMYQHTATQENIAILSRRGVRIIEPESGDLASGLVGPGRLPDVSVLLTELSDALRVTAGDLDGWSILVTAGPTYEEIDPVRFISNYSSGKMGYAIAEAAARRGAIVELVSGPTHLPSPAGVHRTSVTSALEMHDAVLSRAEKMDTIVMAAAVADFRPAVRGMEKLKKERFLADGLTIRLEPNPDILAELGRRKQQELLVGFALETEHDRENALRKLRSKNLDMIVVNNPTVEGAGFGVDTNVATMLFPDGSEDAQPRMSKTRLAERILDHLPRMKASRMA